MKPDHAAAREYAIDRKESSPYMTSINNLAACYLDLTERHVRLLELAKASLDAANIWNPNTRNEADAALRAFIEGERNGL